MSDSTNINLLLSVWIPIIVVFIGALIAHIFNLIEKKRQRENLKNTVVIWLRCSILPMEGFIHSVQTFIKVSKSSPTIMGKQLLLPVADLQCIKEFPIDKMSDALVSRLKVSKKEKPELAKYFYELYDLINSSFDSQSKFTESISFYSKNIGPLMSAWNERFSELSNLIKADCLSEDLDIHSPEWQFFHNIDLLLHEMSNAANNAKGVFQMDIMQSFVQKVTGLYMNSTLTPRINDFYSTFYNFQVVIHNIVELHEYTVQKAETVFVILNSAKESLSEVLAFYEQHKIKSIFSFSNKVS